MELEGIVVVRLSCGRPVCTLADVYTCGNPDCVQLNDPAAQFLFLNAEDSAFLQLGGYFVYSGCSMVLALEAEEFRVKKKEEAEEEKSYVIHIAGASELPLPLQPQLSNPQALAPAPSLVATGTSNACR